jgi:ABC-2 type transport system permease protein
MKPDRTPRMPAVMGAALYEFKMQLRRKALWIACALFCLGFLPLTLVPWKLPAGMPTAEVVATWSLGLQFFHPIAFGVLLADRLPRDRRLGVDELLDTFSAPPGGRFLGKYLGSTLAALVPLALIYAAGLLYVAYDRADPAALPLGALAFLTVNLPGLLFVAAFSVSCPVVMWVPLYQFLFVGYWFWGNLLPSNFDIPNLSGTVLTPFGEYMANGFFGTELATVRAAAWEGALSAGLLLCLGVLALYCAHRYLAWQRERR